MRAFTRSYFGLFGHNLIIDPENPPNAVPLESSAPQQPTAREHFQCHPPKNVQISLFKFRCAHSDLKADTIQTNSYLDTHASITFEKQLNLTNKVNITVNLLSC